MITPSFALTATERVLPKLALDFTTAILDSRVTFTRSGNTATVTDSSGVIVAINANLPRFDYNPSTLLCNGLLIEESRTNVLLNSLIDGTSLATQTVVVTAAARTLTFYGTGQIVLSGAHSATVTGTGAYPTRTTLTFTPSAGALILTVTGTVQFAQLETGSFATSFIPTSAAQVTRTADLATMTGANFSDWFNASEGAVFIEASINFTPLGAGSPELYSINSGTAANIFAPFFANGTGFLNTNVRSGNSSQAVLASTSAATVGTVFRHCATYKVNSFASSFNAATPATDSSGAVPVGPNVLILGDSSYNAVGNKSRYMRKFFYYPQRLTNAELQAFSK